ncbi:hypothetical protein LCGC14_0326270 [marine sediment metagenome]|uniref:Uncharacterized protein n=1 Tax=marine sediment metagenome TaxID=412755 RepID=A0A0F9W592_9ZZZZ
MAKKAAPKAKSAESKTEALQITAPNLRVAEFLIEGTSPYVQNRFPNKALAEMRAKQEAGSTATKGAKRKPKNFKECYENAMHKAEDGGWHGLPAPGLRAAMISACKLCGFAMTRGKLALVIQADGYGSDGTPLVKITKGKPKYSELPVRNATGVVDIRARPMWSPGWQAKVRVEYDADQFTAEDVGNLLLRVGLQVGIGEGRNDSKKSTGLGWGFFKIAA